MLTDRVRNGCRRSPGAEVVSIFSSSPILAGCRHCDRFPSFQDKYRTPSTATLTLDPCLARAYSSCSQELDLRAPSPLLGGYVLPLL